MPTESADDGALDELLPLARVSTEATAARRWLEDALIAARGTVEPQLAAAGATRAPKKPPPAKHNAPLKKIERTAAQLIAALEQLRRHPYAHGSFWRFKAFGPVYASGFERAGVMPTLTNVREAARKAQIRRTGRPRNVRKQHIVDLALAFAQGFHPIHRAATSTISSRDLLSGFSNMRSDCPSTTKAVELIGKSEWQYDGCRLKWSAPSCSQPS